MEEQKPKRKTRTSTDVKRRYNEKTYTRLVFNLKKEKAEAYKEKCKELGIPYTQPFHDAVDKILEEK